MSEAAAVSNAEAKAEEQTHTQIIAVASPPPPLIQPTEEEEEASKYEINGNSSLNDGSADSDSAIVVVVALTADALALTAAAADRERDQKQREAEAEKQKRTHFMLWFGNDAVELIYMALGPHDLARCCLVCRTLNQGLVVIFQRLVNVIIKAKYYNSRHVRVPNPGEVLYQDAATNGGAPIVAASFLRQYRDMTRQRVLLMGGSVVVLGSVVAVNRVDMLDTFPKPKTEEEKEEEEVEGGGVKIERTGCRRSLRRRDREP